MAGDFRGAGQYGRLDLHATGIQLRDDQEGEFYNGYYGGYCYLPLYIVSGEWLLSSLLQFAGQDASAGYLNPLHILVGRIQGRWRDTKIIVRADSGIARERIMRWCEEWGTD